MPPRASFGAEIDTSSFLSTAASWVIGILLLSALSYIAFRIAYKVIMFRRSMEMVSLSVLLPKKQSQMDKQNETEGNMKEVVAVMEQFFTSLTATHDKPWEFKSLFACDYLAQGDRIRFIVSCRSKFVGKVENAINSYYSDAVVEPIYDYNIFPEGSFQAACVARLASKDFKPLHSYNSLGVDPINAVTNALSKIKNTDCAAISFVFKPLKRSWGQPGRKYSQKKVMTSRQAMNGGGNGKPAGLLTSSDEEDLKTIEGKANKVGFGVTMRIVASSATQVEADTVLSQIKSAFEQYARPGLNHFVFRSVFTKRIVRDFIFKNIGFGQRMMKLSSEEFASLFHFPHISYNKAPNIVWQTFKLLPPPQNLPPEAEEGLYLGENRYRGVSTPVWINEKDRFRHFYIIGQTGTGKSVMIKNLARQDAIKGRGFCIIDPHGDLAEDTLSYIPKERVDDVVYFDPGDVKRPMGLNLLEAETPEDRDRIALDATAMMIKLFGEEVFSARLQEYFQNGVLTLMEDTDDPGTLLDVVRMFTDEAYQKSKVAKCTNSTVLNWWNTTYANMGDREKQEIIPYFSSKFNQFRTNMTMRNIVGQQRSAFSIKDIMDNNKILLVNLSKGKLGDLNASLLGMILVSKIQGATMGRSSIPEDERVPFYLYLDEFQNVVTDAIESILSEARKYKLGLIMAHQYLGQLDKAEEVKKAVFGNCGSMMSYKIGAEDAEYMSKEFAPAMSDQDLVNIAKLTAVMKMSIDTQPSEPFTIHIPFPPRPDQKMLLAMKQLSRLKYGRDARFVNREMDLRMKGM